MSQKNNRNIYSLLNAFSAILLTLVNGLMGIVATRLILEHWDTFATLGRGFRRVLEDAAEKNPNFQVMFL